LFYFLFTATVHSAPVVMTCPPMLHSPLQISSMVIQLKPTISSSIDSVAFVSLRTISFFWFGVKTYSVAFT
jgi:hypothetical protein